MNQTKTKNRRLVLKLIPSLFMAAALGLCIFRIILLFNHIDSINGLYLRGSEQLGTIFSVCTMVLFIGSLVMGFVANRYDYPRPIKNEAVSVALAASLCGLMMLTILIGNIYDIVRGIRPFGFLLGVESVLCLPSSAYFFYICTHGAKVDAAERTFYNLLPLFPAVYLAIRTITLFINTTTQINASQRSYVLLTLICMMMFFVTEAEFTLPQIFRKKGEEEHNAIHRISVKYYALGLASCVLVMAVIISYATAQAYGFYKTEHLLYSMMDLMLGFYALVRVYTI